MSWRLHPARDFARFAAEWDLLASRYGGPAFLRSAFIAPLLIEFSRGNELLAVNADDAGPAAMTLVVPTGRGGWETFQPSQLPLGPWIMRPGEPIGALAGNLLRRLPGLALRLGLTQLDPHLVTRPVDHETIDTLDYIRTAWVEVAGSFADYWALRGKNLRANMRKQRRKLEADGVATRLEILTQPGDVATAIESYGRLESAGWKSALGTAIDSGNRQGRFYCAMLENFCAGGAGRVYRYWFADRIVAIDLCIEHAGTLVVLKTTYDEGLKPLSPAFLLREDELQAIFDEARIRRVEFFGRLMDWHAQWTQETRTLYHLNCYRWHWIRRARAWRMRTRGPIAPLASPGATAGSASSGGVSSPSLSSMASE